VTNYIVARVMWWTRGYLYCGSRHVTDTWLVILYQTSCYRHVASYIVAAVVWWTRG